VIHVSHLTKYFGAAPVIRDVSFDVRPGEIVGILGPNGAGKTTLMRVLACYFPASGGQVTVDGLDVFSDSLAVRERIGYLPEHVPLLPDMRVSEYLRYRGQLKGLKGRDLRRRVNEVISLCGLADAHDAIIGRLSRGYRQRIGLADALVSNPKVLILDEPSLGLDPNQIRQVRATIRAQGREHTVLLSSHILSEVEMTCDRVLIMDKGRILASGTPGELSRLHKAGSVVVAELSGPSSDIVARAGAVTGVVRAEATGLPDGWVRLSCEVASDADVRADVSALAATNGWRLRELRWERRTLEDVFVAMTKGTP
jgi:ABC-2 type transport system ATP-binding protein